MPIANVAVLVSGGGTNLQSVIDAAESGEINAKICAVISSKEGVYALERAKKHGIFGAVVSRRAYNSQQEFEEALIKTLSDAGTDYIVCAGYLSIIGESIIEKYRNRIINVHPALIPSFCGKGYYGDKVHKAAIEIGRAHV